LARRDFGVLAQRVNLLIDETVDLASNAALLYNHDRHLAQLRQIGI
jgi:hypothetical protein